MIINHSIYTGETPGYPIDGHREILRVYRDGWFYLMDGGTSEPAFKLDSLCFWPESANSEQIIELLHRARTREFSRGNTLNVEILEEALRLAKREAAGVVEP